MTGTEKKLARALKDATDVTGLSTTQLRMIQLRIKTLSAIVAREHDAEVERLKTENEALRAEVERLQQGPNVNELDEFIKQHGVK
jgi:cell division protein FtsB